MTGLCLCRGLRRSSPRHRLSDGMGINLSAKPLIRYLIKLPHLNHTYRDPFLPLGPRPSLCETMRLLQCRDTGEFSLTKDFSDGEAIPRYAILSHTWENGQEVTYKDLMDGTGKSKSGYDKIQFCGQQAESDGL